MRRPALTALLVAGAAACALLDSGSAQAQAIGELVDPTQLRVCADPNHLPLSDNKGGGFENKIAELMAKKLGLPLTYTWYPNTVGFVRNTLRAGRCDLIMGVIAADELVQNSNPYYRSSFVMMRRAEDAARFADLDSPEMTLARIGVIAGTPPSTLLGSKNLFSQMRPYQLYVDSRVDDPAGKMLDDLAAGNIDVALVWGPIGGWYARNSKVPLKIDPLPSDPRSGLRMDFRISMGMRAAEPEWKHKINELIRELRPQIEAVLADYGVPMLDERGQLMTASTVGGAPASAVPEPTEYRMDRYRAPVPATLQGATVVDTAGLERLIAEQRPVVVDVIAQTRKPPDRTADQIWIAPKRNHLPGSVWLPNVGYGELTPEFRDYFRAELQRLTGGDKTKPLVFYCDANCWMGWNAAKRAISELGYSRVYWYPEGAQGWQKAGHQLVEAEAPQQPEFPH